MNEYQSKSGTEKEVVKQKKVKSEKELAAIKKARIMRKAVSDAKRKTTSWKSTSVKSNKHNKTKAQLVEAKAKAAARKAEKANKIEQTPEISECESKKCGCCDTSLETICGENK